MTTLLVFVGLMITSVITITAQTPTSGNNDIVVQYAAAPSHFAKATTVHLSRPATLGGDQITAGDYNESHPSIAADPTERLFAGYEGTTDGSTYYPLFAFSDDWTNAGYFQECSGFTYPRVDHKASGFYGTMSPWQDSSTYDQVWVVDATVDPISGVYWQLSALSLSQLNYMDIGTYTHAGPNGDPGDWNFGVVAYTGFNGYQGLNIQGCPFIIYSYSATGGGIGWLSGSSASGCVHSDAAIDQITNMSYAVYDRFDGSLYSLLLRKDNFGKWTDQGNDFYTHPNVATKTVTATGNIQNPSIVANNNIVLLVAQNDVSGSQDIICYRSTNGFSSNTAITIANSASDEMYPKVTLMEDTAVCTYVKDGQVYYKVSEDAGATWGAETLANTDDAVVAEYGCTDIAAAGTNVYDIWQDSRGANRDIYVNAFHQLTAPIVEIGAINGAVGKVTAEIKNTGTGAATNVAWTLTVKGGILGRINKVNSGTIATLDAGATNVVSVSGIFGLGAITAKVTATGTADKTETGKVIIVFVKI